MAYEVLARKWRPQQFDEVVGQPHVTRTLANAIAAGRVAHAYLFVGPRGIGKTSLSRILAKALNCDKGPTATPCGVCSACREIAAGNCLDVIEFDAASNTQVDKVRDIIIGNVAYAPAHCRTKVYIVDEVHMLSSGSFNALLKTLEEPPPHVKFIFATTEAHKVPATIVSRCQRFDLRRLSARDIVAHLDKIAKAESIAVSPDALLAIARGAEGGMRDAESALDQLMAFQGSTIEEADVLSVFGLVSRQALEELTAAILSGDITSLIRQVDRLDQGGKDLQRVVVELLDVFRALLVLASAPEAADALDLVDEQAVAYRALASQAKPDNLLRIADLLVETENRMRYTLSRRTLLETALIRCARTAESVSIDQLLTEILALKSSLAAAASSSPPPPVQADRPASRYAVRVPEPAAAADDGAAALVELRGRWATVAAEAGKRVEPVKNLLLHGRPVAVDGDRVVVAFEAAFAGQVSRLRGTPRFLNAVQAGLQEVLRRPVRVELTIGEESADPPEPAAAAAVPPAADGPEDETVLSRRELIEHPTVQAAVRVMKGRIVGVRLQGE